MDEWQERRKQEELEQERKRKQEEIEKRARILREQATPTGPTQPQKCPEGEEWSDELHQCVKKKPPTPVKPIVEQIQTAPYTPPGPPEATIEKQLERIEFRLELIKSQVIGFLQAMKSLGYDVSALLGEVKR